MIVVITNTYEELSAKAADHLVSAVSAKRQPLICTASGDSPAGLYKELIKRVKAGSLDVSNWNFVGLDEWAGMNEEDDGSCRFHLNNQLFHPLKIENERICFFNGRASDLQQECKLTEDFIRRHGGIDVAIIGLGMNGHVGMNEPGTPPALHAHVAEIDPVTQKVGQKYFTKAQQLSHGLTLGIATLMEAKQVVLIVNGEHKAEIVKEVLEGKISEQLPGSLLRKHPGFAVFLDTAAARLVSPGYKMS